MAKKIIITVGLAGETTVQTHGYTGATCKDASRFIEEAIGEKTAEQLTPDYHRIDTTARNRTTQGH